MATKKTTTKRALLTSIHDGLIGHPDLAERIDTILKIANNPSSGGEILSADQVESMLIEELRKLGNETLVGWAEEVDCQLGDELKKEDSSVRMREKKL